jgi:hypothetical protein
MGDYAAGRRKPLLELIKMTSAPLALSQLTTLNTLEKKLRQER